MDVFQQHPQILQGADAKKIIKNYNKLAKVLLEFEVLYHRSWMKQVSSRILDFKLLPVGSTLTTNNMRGQF